MDIYCNDGIYRWHIAKKIEMYQLLLATWHYVYNSICVIVLWIGKRTRVTIVCILQFKDPTSIIYNRL